MTTNRDIIIWEWMEENGQWIPYEPELCCEFEGKRWTQDTLKFGDSKYGPDKYEMDFKCGVQRSLNLGHRSERHVRRKQLPSTSALANGITWDWHRGKKKNAVWTMFATNCIEYLEQQSLRKKVFEFPDHYGMNHTIDLGRNQQTNKSTKYKRDIRRRKLQHPFPQVTTSTTLPMNGFSGRGMASTNAASNTMSNPSILRPGRLAPNFQNTNSSGAAGGAYPGLHQPSTYSTSRSSSNGAISKRHMPGFTMHPQSGLGMSSSAVAASAAPNGRRKQEKRKYDVPPCPARGIPCGTPGSSGAVDSSTVFKNFTKPAAVDPSSTEDCAICQMPLTDESGFSGADSTTGHDTCKLKLCNHVFHTECVQATYEHGVKKGCIICPACNKMHGVKTGNQPPGTMHYKILNNSLPGFNYCDTFMITYDIQPGTQTKEHPHPGRPYHTQGFPRIAFLPDNDDGCKVLLLLIEAWKRRLIFTVGQSSTTGREDCVTWTGIHHKTEMSSRRGHGYPDDGYFDRVLLELAASPLISLFFVLFVVLVFEVVFIGAHEKVMPSNLCHIIAGHNLRREE